MDREEIIEKITQKKEFSELPEKDVELAFEKFDKPRNADYQKIKLTRDFLRKVYSSFSSRKLLTPKEKNPEWVLMKHKSTKERYEFYNEIYLRILKDIDKSEKLSVIDLGCGANGFSYNFLKNISPNIRYTGVEAVGQLVKLTNLFFEHNKIEGKVFHLSLFDGDKIIDLIKKQKSPRIIFLFKVIDSLEVMERDYSKKLLNSIVPFSERIVLSFATKSLGSRKKFSVQRGWILKFIKENFELLDDFEINGERYVVFRKEQ